MAHEFDEDIALGVWTIFEMRGNAAAILLDANTPRAGVDGAWVDGACKGRENGLPFDGEALSELPNAYPVKEPPAPGQHEEFLHRRARGKNRIRPVPMTPSAPSSCTSFPTGRQPVGMVVWSKV